MSAVWRIYIKTCQNLIWLDSALQLKDLTEAVQQLSTGKAHGLDGLPSEFCIQLWNLLKDDSRNCLPVVKEIFYPYWHCGTKLMLLIN